MKIVQRSNYLIYFDDVRVDPFVIHFSSTLGLYASDASASITMFRSDALDNWNAYLTQVKIFGENPFTKKFTMIFDGEIMSRNWNHSKSDMGKVTFSITGHYHWLEIPVPLAISTEESMNQLQRFIYEAQNINIEEVQTLVQSQSESLMKEKSIKEIITELFQKITAGYYEVGKGDSRLGFAGIEDRFKVMVDVMKEFRDAGFLDMFTFTYATQIDSFYAYLNQVLEQLMFEFYEDRDGSFRIKSPSWGDPVLKSHILDASLVSTVSGLDDWKNEPTRVLAIGASSQIMEGSAGASGDIASDAVMSSTIPVGLYIGNPRDPESEMYYSQSVQLERYGIGAEDTSNLGGGVGGSAPPSSGSALAVIEGARKFIGKLTYVLGGNNIDNGYGDCSNFTQYIFNKYAAVKLGKTTANQQSDGSAISESEALPGDIVLFHKTMSSRPSGVPSHVGIISNKDTMIHLSDSGCAEINYKKNSYWGPKILKFRRVLSSVGAEPAPAPTSSTQPTAPFQAPYKTPGGGMTAASVAPSISTKNAEPWIMHECSSYNAMCPAVTIKGVHYQACSGITATGVDVRDESIDHRIVAVDKTRIPLHSIVEVEGLGFFSALDTGGYIKGTRIDILAPSHAAAMKFGRKKLRVRIVRRGKGTDGKRVPPVPAGAAYVTPTGTSMPFSPYSSTGEYVPKGLVRNESFRPSENTGKKVTGVSYPSKSPGSVSVPSYSSAYKSLIKEKPNGIDPHLIASIIANGSGWRENYESTSHVGLMNIPQNYVRDVLEGQNVKDGANSIYLGTQFLANAMGRFSNKVTFALAAYHLGNFETVQNITKEVGVLDFSKARSKIPAATVAFVDNVIETYAYANGGTYIKGDPHTAISEESGSEKGGASSGDDVPDYESDYKPHLSEEELQFKMKLQIIEQPLIRNDSAVLQGEGSMTADKLMYQYAKYMMQLYRAKAHNIQVGLTTCLPFLRPGFNAWLEPTRTNLVFYITGLSHNGSFGQGCYTSVNGGFVRDPETFQDLDKSIFIGDILASTEDFGETTDYLGMSAIRNELSALEGKDIVEEAQNVEVLKKLYTSQADKTEYTTEWNNEYSLSDIERKIKALFEFAPPIIKGRKAETRRVMDASKAIFIEKLHHFEK